MKRGREHSQISLGLFLSTNTLTIASFFSFSFYFLLLVASSQLDSYPTEIFKLLPQLVYLDEMDCEGNAMPSDVEEDDDDEEEEDDGEPFSFVTVAPCTRQQ